MNKLLISTLCLAATFSYGQVKDTLSHRLKGTDYTLPEFSFYSKNYHKIFDYYQYTFDAQKISQKSVYVSSDNKFYFGDNGGIIMDMAQPSYNAYRNNVTYAYDLSGLYRGLKNIFEMEKDYSVKRKNDSPPVYMDKQ